MIRARPLDVLRDLALGREERGESASSKSGASCRSVVATDSVSRHLPCARLGARFPRRAEIGQLRLDAFDLEADRRAAGEDELDRAGRLPGRREADGEQLQHLALLPLVEAAGLDAEHPVEMQDRAPALERPASKAAARLLPHETVHRHDEPLLHRSIRYVPDLQDRVLEMGRYDPQVFLVESQELQHGLSIRRAAFRCRMLSVRTLWRPTQPGSGLAVGQSLMRSTSAPQRDSFSSSRSKPRSRW